MESELRGIEGLKEMRAKAREGQASVTLLSQAGTSTADAALDDVREKVDLARAELPMETEEPRVSEVNVALFPVLVRCAIWHRAERRACALASLRTARRTLEALSGVLEVDIGGDRDEVLGGDRRSGRRSGRPTSASPRRSAQPRAAQQPACVAAGALETGPRP
ncbi:MAG: efflux RND transporter permease subunit [Halofilum sp. (in: g-proteobacteria)]|nr:efflux RND transporter permease subunit [Halofilum sp. (in: g-proteobacteria)]